MEANARPEPAAEVAARVGPLLDADRRVRFAYLFGSCARGSASERSDVDLAVYLSGNVTLADEARLEGDLARAVGGDVDLVAFNRAPLWLQFRILGEGIPVYTRDEGERIAFRERVERAFLDFRPYHEAYLEAVRERARRGALSDG